MMFLNDLKDKNKDEIEDRIDSILDGADGIDFDPKKAGYVEISPGFWDDGTDFGDMYVETTHLDKKFKRNVTPDDNIYWLSKKSFLSVWVYIMIALAILMPIDLLWTYYAVPHDIGSIIKLDICIALLFLLLGVILLIGDLVFIPYHYDRKHFRTQKINGEMWFFSTESEVNVIKAGESTRYFPESLRVQRSKIFFRDLDSDFVPQCKKRLNPYDHEKISKSDMAELKKMVLLRIVFTSKKYQLFKKLYDADPDNQYEIIFYEKSKVIKELRPLKGKEYSAEALELLYLINRMYP